MQQVRLFGRDTRLAFLQSQLLRVPALLLSLFLLFLGRRIRIAADSRMSVLVDALQRLRRDAMLNELREVTLVTFLVFLLQSLHVLGNVLSEDAIAMSLSIVLLGRGIVAEETSLTVWNVDSAISSTLHHSEHLGTSACASEPNIQDCLEGIRIVTLTLDVVVLAINFLSALVQLVKVELLQMTTSEQQSGTVGSSIVGEPDLHAIARQLMSIRRVHNHVSVDTRVGDLRDDVLVGEANDQTVLRRVVLVLVLNSETLASIVVRLAFTAALELRLEALEVGAILHDLDQTH